MFLKISGPKYELKILNWKLRSKTQFTLELRRVNCKLLSKERLPCRQFCLLTFNQIAFSSPFKLDTYWNVTLVMHALWLCPAKKIFSILHNNSSISHRLSADLLHSSLAITSSFTINTYNKTTSNWEHCIIIHVPYRFVSMILWKLRSIQLFHNNNKRDVITYALFRDKKAKEIQTI